MENDKIDVGEGIENRKISGKSRLIKTAKTSTKLVAVFIVALFLLNGLAVAQSTSIDVDVNRLPYDSTFGIDQEVTLNLMNINGKTTLLVTLDGVSSEVADINLYLNSKSIGTVEKNTANLFIITITGGSSLRFYALAGMHVRVEKIEGSMVHCPSNSKISGETFYKIWNECYVAEINLPSNKIHQITLTSEKDITYMGITGKSILAYGVANNTKIALPENTNLKLVSNASVKFNLRIEEEQTSTKRSLTEQTTVVGINVRSQSDPTNFNNIMIENIEPEMLKWSLESYADISREWLQNSTVKYDPTFSWKTQTNSTTQEYYDNMNDAIISPPIPLNLSSDPTLSFWTKYDMEGSQWVTIGWTRLLDREFGLPVLLTNSADTDTPGSYILNISATEVYTYDNISFGVASSGIIDNVTWYFGDGEQAYGVMVNHSYTNDGNYTTYCVVNGDDGYAKFPIEITVLNRAPVPVIDAYRLINVTLRVAGRKNNSVTITLLEDNISVGQTTVIRESDNPDETSKTITLKVRGKKNYQALLQYDGGNGGANPIRLLFTLQESDGLKEINITFNSVNGMYQEQTINISSTVEELLEDNTMIIFNASESYDIDGTIADYVWGFGDETNSIGMVVNHMYAVHGVYNVTLNVTDDDGSTNETMIPVELSIPRLLIDQYHGVDSILPSSEININWDRLRGDWPRIDWERQPRRILMHYDNIWVEISTDNISWNTLSVYPRTDVKNSSNVLGNVDGWVKQEVGLSSYAGGNVLVRFRMATDGSVEYTAPYIDDVQIGENNKDSNRVVLTHENTYVSAGSVIHTVRVENNGDTTDTFTMESTYGTLDKTSVTLITGESALVSIQTPPPISIFTGNPYDIDSDGINNAEEFYLPYYYGKIYAKDYFDSRNITKDASNPPVPLDVADISNYTVLYGNNSQMKLKMNIIENGSYKIDIAGIAAVNDMQESRLSNPIDISLENQNGEFMITNYANTHSCRGSNDTCNMTYWWNNYTFKAYLGKDTYNITIGLNSSTYDALSQPILLLNHLYLEKYGINPLSNDSDVDGINDINEYLDALSPCSADTDNDYIMDNVEIGWWQTIHTLSFSESVKRADNPDFDNDRLVDGFELLYNTNITNPDSDNDGLNDYDEIFEYTKAERIEAEDALLYETNNLIATENGVILQSNKSSELKMDFEVSEKSWYRVKLVGNSITNSSVVKETETTYTHTGTGKSMPIASNDTGTATTAREIMADEVATNTTNITVSSTKPIYKFSTGSIELKTKLMEERVEITDGRYYSIYGDLEKSTHTLHYKLSPSTYDNFTFEIDYFIIERQGLDPWDNDTDNDGLLDGDEVINYGTSPWTNDTDNDMINDFDEINTYYTNPNSKDTDNDGLNDHEEIFTYRTYPARKDSDFDGIDDKEEIDYWNITRGLSPSQAGENATKTDADNDYMPDGYEIKNSLDPLDFADADSNLDSDGLTNVQEYNLGTNISEPDTDNDGLKDGEEIISIMFRTDIRDGAVNINGYRSLTNEDLLNKWIYYNNSEWVNGKKYVYYGTDTNISVSVDASPLNNQTKLILTLKDGTGIYLTTENKIIGIWEPNADINDADGNGWIEGTYYRFCIYDVVVETSNLPVPGYKNQEIFYGPNPLVNDTDRDGVLDGDEYDWNQDTDSDGVINVLDRDSDNDGLTDGQEYFGGSWWSGMNNQDSDSLPNMVDPDSDNDNLPDSLELMPLSDTDGNGLPNFIDPDSDGDGLWDGFHDTHNYDVCDPDEFGEDVNCNGIVDVGETSPIRWDSDNDQLSDGQEISSAVLWYEAENSVAGTTGIIVNDAFASNNMSATNSTGDNQICGTTSSVPDGTYVYYIRARLTQNVTSSGLRVQICTHVATGGAIPGPITSILDKNITVSTNSYRWYVTEAFEKTGVRITLSLTGNYIYVDRVIIVRKNIIEVNTFSDGLTEKTLTFDSAGNQTVNITIPITDEPAYVTEAKMNVTGNVYLVYWYNPITHTWHPIPCFPKNTSLDVGNDTYIDWEYPGLLTTTETIDFSYALNQFLLLYTSTPTPAPIMLRFHSDTVGKLNVSNISIILQSYLTDPTCSDTDFDGLNDGDEIGSVETDNLPNTYLTNPINPDCDNDSLLDGQEMKGWYIMVEQGDEEHLTHVTSNPLMVDSDADGLLDSEEIFNAVYWVSEAENY
ncbi:MAG: PKD domain-containing protein, partial [Thermoplasmatales archaeon]|nr:PKD domain-containing protein [Thermoplasmatales archaeon]